MQESIPDSLVYLDYNATTPIDPRVLDAMLPWWSDASGNPSSAHAWGLRARRALDTARAQVADLLGCDPEEIIFTGGGSEACNHAIKGCCWARQDAGRHVVVSAIEHPAVVEPTRWLALRGWRSTSLPVDADGVVEIASLDQTLEPDTILACVMHANNETGVIQPLAGIAERLRGRDVWLFADCAQTVGKIPVRVRELGVDLAGLAGHKLYAPKGIGALYVRRGLRLDNLIHGAQQESGRRAGTEAVALAVGLGEACRLASVELEAEAKRLADLRNKLAARLLELVSDAVVHAEQAPRLPGTLSMAFPGRNAAAILTSLQNSLAASAGAACHGAGGKVSGVLAAMGVPIGVARGTIRLSVGRFTTSDEIERAAELLARAMD